MTTLVMGNCGFGVAPTLEQHRDLVLKTLENVEGMDLACLREGLGDWGFQGFAEYLDAVEALSLSDAGAHASDIAARAGLSQGATYYHFRSKDDLSLRLLRPHSGRRGE